MNTIPGTRSVCLFLALAVMGLTGFVHPVLCVERDGRVQWEMDASRCCSSGHAGAPDTAGAGPVLAAAGGCDACIDIHVVSRCIGPSAPGTPALSSAPAAEPARPVPESLVLPSSPSVHLCSASPPPSNLRC